MMRTGGYAPNFRIPARRSPSKLMWLVIVLSIVFPPLALILLWGKVRCPLRGKILLTLVSVISMTAMFVAINRYINRPSALPAESSVYTVGAGTYQPTPAPATVYTGDPVVPANPLN